MSETTSNSKNFYYIVTYRDPEKMIGSSLAGSSNNSLPKNITLKVKTIKDSTLGLGFISMSDFIFDPHNSPIIDPQEEQLRKRFENTNALHLSIYHIISIEEVGLDHLGLTFTRDKGNLLFISPKES